MPYFAAALARTPEGWSGREFDLEELTDLEDLTDALRDLTGDGAGPALLLLEEDDEYVAVVRVDGGVGSLSEPRVFLSDQRAVLASEVAAMLWEEGEVETEVDLEPDEQEETGGKLGEPVGDHALLADLGTSALDLLGLCAEEGLLPADVISALAERGGFGPALDGLREG